MTEPAERTTPPPNGDAKNVTVSKLGEEHDKSTPLGPGEEMKKAAHEAAAEDGPWEKVKAVGRELDREFGGEYERREDEASKPK